ncbi:hypothetical protein Nepgr_026097 [Nepenthes gracilis]|uniref:DOG1 domain-containing protein n=1 Tax=Nepenthes gracilis TaxID=150966 RepID=A0AAD3Y1S0_NEPGR|nr:hypothetical protein Nepgr_026097 [Nepenthes gracilis]
MRFSNHHVEHQFKHSSDAARTWEYAATSRWQPKISKRLPLSSKKTHPQDATRLKTAEEDRGSTPPPSTRPPCPPPSGDPCRFSLRLNNPPPPVKLFIVTQTGGSPRPGDNVEKLNDGRHRFQSLLRDMVRPAQPPNHTTHRPSQETQTTEDNQHCRRFVEEVMSHHAEFYRVKSLAARTDVLSLFSAQWASSFERSLQWVAGLRPTNIFHLVCTESSIRFESNVINVLRGQRTGELGELSPGQLGRVSELQCETVRTENEISDELSQWQDGLASVDWDGSISGGGGVGGVEGKLVRLVEVVEANRLRMGTLWRLVELLTP